ncbi:MAG: hypothetical protein ACT4ON_09520 [Bacteroidota bacterium]
MGNDTNSKLDQVVKQTLGNYEATHSTPDWSKMEGMLDATPQSANFKWSYSLNVIIGLVILGGGFLIYSLISSEKSSTVPQVQQPIENKSNSTVTTKSVPAPAPSVPVVSAPAEHTPPQTTLPSGTAVVKNSDKETVAAEKTNNSKTEDIVKDKEKKSVKLKQVINTMGNEPVFGDMLDSSKGIVGKTKEKEETKKAAKAQPENTIGWSSFLMKNNLDSLKKYHEQQQKDSLKK